VRLEAEMLELAEEIMSKRPNKSVWTEEDLQRLRLHIEAGGSLGRAAVKFKRTAQALRSKARELGWKFPTIRQLRAASGIRNRRERDQGQDTAF
jgi:hypothetical protein